MASDELRRSTLPESTYRVQFHAGFTFRDCMAITPYLRDLGITHVYASPYLKAKPGSMHGYDIIDHCSLNGEVGSEADYAAWVESLRENGMSHILDMVPNHAGIATNENVWWNDVLEKGRASKYGSFFDIAWRGSPRPQMHDKVLLPLLGERYAEVLEKGQLKLTFENGAFAVHYYERRFPIDPRTYGKILGHGSAQVEEALVAQGGPDDIKRRLAKLATQDPAVRRLIEQRLAAINGTPGEPRSFDALDELLNEQHYRLAYWRTAPDEINYRRFFDVNDLAALSMEREDVFRAAHTLVLQLLAKRMIAGLRIDHPDGLYDPREYFRRLQEAYLAARGGKADGGKWPLYVVAEKILAADEELPPEWAVYGTSGYEFVNQVNGLFVDGSREEAFTRLYRELTGSDASFAEIAYRRKLLVLDELLASELQMLAHRLDCLAQKDRGSRDYTLSGLRRALREVIACFPVYRTYITGEPISEADRRYVEAAIGDAIERNPRTDPAILQYIRDVLLLRYPERFREEERAEQRQFVGKFQQVTAPATAKGIEDTAFYVYDRLVSLNEVGGDPGRFGLGPGELHMRMRDRQALWPYALSPLSTHDTKRSEDVRARLDVLSEIPDQWRECVARWMRLNGEHRKMIGGRPAPDANEEYLVYQTLVGAWPLGAIGGEERATFVARIQAYMLKALREAKVHTTWIDPNAEYEEAVQTFVGRVLDEQSGRAFLADFLPFQARISNWGLFNSLSQTLLRITLPGVPDTYQGTELWDFSLVDPDNRRPVDYEARRDMLEGLKHQWTMAGEDRRGLVRQLVERRQDGEIKMLVTWQALTCRSENPGLFSAGEYLPMQVVGGAKEHIFAFARRAGEKWAVAIVPRLLASLRNALVRPMGAEVWDDTAILLPEAGPTRGMRNVLTGQRVAGQVIRVADVLEHCSVGLLLAT